ncbi:MAG TPA: hypothetical protein VE709_00840 [Pseudonocardiaceae bacterium]|nr:hypothetical protein [Pseudonocardiaceae bacterium]
MVTQGRKDYPMHPTDPAPVQEAPERGDAYGTPRRLWAALERHRPPGPSNLRWWRSPLRGPWLTSVLGAVLLAALPIVSVTGLLSWVAYGPQFGQAIPADPGGLYLPVFGWPTSPSWLFRLNQGLHVGLGLVLIPVVLAKLWSVAPRPDNGRMTPLRKVGDFIMRSMSSSRAGGGTMKPELSGAKTNVLVPESVASS